MLTLTKRQHESILINNSIRVAVQQIENDRVTLGISAPRQVPIYGLEKRRRGPSRPLRTYSNGPLRTTDISRTAKEVLLIGSDVSITVLYIGLDEVRLGISAPSDVTILREGISGTLPRSPTLPPDGTGTAASQDGIGIDIYIDPGDASKDVIQEVLESLSDLHIASGGLGLEFVADDTHVHAMEGILR